MLLIDDDAALQETYRQALRGEGHTVLAAREVTDGIALLSWGPDVIVVDLDLAVDSFVTVSELRAATKAPVLIVGSRRPPLVGPDSPIQAPIDLERFIHAVQAVARSATTTSAGRGAEGLGHWEQGSGAGQRRTN
ncbi:MAG TPA: hypothetical protein VNB64_09295 [Solirubrobacteraceae bacterium]|nr:hypothetical protein [Solirubrobacteraceae bacterium]